MGHRLSRKNTSWPDDVGMLVAHVAPEGPAVDGQ